MNRHGVLVASDSSQPTSKKDREDIATGWLIDQNDPGFTAAQREELVDWLTQDKANCREYVNLVRRWQWTSVLGRTPAGGHRKSKAAMPETTETTVPGSAG